MAGADFSTSTRSTDAATRIAALEVALAERDARIAELLRERDELRAAYDRLWLEVELMRRRIFIAKAERVDTTQLELEFKDKLAALDKLAGTLGIGPASDATDGKNAGSRPKPKGRRDLRQIKMPEERVEIPDPAVEALVAQGQAERIGFEESTKIAWHRGGPRRLIVARVKYRVPDANNPSPETTQIATARPWRPRYSRARSPRSPSSRTSSSISTAMACRSIASSTASSVSAWRSIAAPCAGGPSTPARRWAPPWSPPCAPTR
jgi:transposase